MKHDPFEYTLLDPAFFHQLVLKLSKAKTDFADPLEELICSCDLKALTDFERSGLQSSLSWHSSRKARDIAYHLVNEKGDIDPIVLKRAITLLEDNLYYYFKPAFDSANRHLLTMLKLLQDTKINEVVRQIRGPYSPREEEVIRKTLQLGPKERVTDKRAKEAILSALFTPLRQRVGSCFATQSAIFVQKEKSERFIRELKFLIERDYLISVNEGIEYQIPFCSGGGVGELFSSFLFWEKDFKEIERSPGLIHALQAVSLADKIDVLLEPIAKEVLAHPFDVWNANNLLTKILQAHFHIKDEEIVEWREQEERQNIALSLARGHLSAKRREFIETLEKAKEAYISTTENHLLRSWEYTIASFAEMKGDFATWNLFYSLGLDHREKNGIGFAIKCSLESYLERIQSQIVIFDADYERLCAEVALYEKSIMQEGYYQALYFAKKAELNRVQKGREDLYDKARRVASSLGFFIEFYMGKFKEYFQEIFDPAIEGEAHSVLDDRPAGFRLYYKHGRLRPSLWTAITTPASYVESLCAFFVACEVMLSHEKTFEALHDLVSLVTGDLLLFLRRSDFLETSFERLYSSYHEPLPVDPLKNLKSLNRTPWCYVSGGNLETFLSAYKPDGERLRKVDIEVESPLELLSFYIETLKDLPQVLQKRISDNPESSLLAFSPTHAFLFKPAWLGSALESLHYSRNWIRDQIKEDEAFLFSQILDHEKVQSLLEAIDRELIPTGYRLLFRQSAKQIGSPLTVMEFFAEVMRVLSYEWWMKDEGRRSAMERGVTALLYRKLPIVSMSEIDKKLPLLFSEFDEPLSSQLKTIFNERRGELRGVTSLSSDQLFLILRGMIMMATARLKGPRDYTRELIAKMRKYQLCLPEPILFADSNWQEILLGFAVSPSSGSVELFGFDEWGHGGFPLLEWAPYLNGMRPGKWGLFIPY